MILSAPSTWAAPMSASMLSAPGPMQLLTPSRLKIRHRVQSSEEWNEGTVFHWKIILISQLKIDLLIYMNIYLCVCDIYTYIHIYTHTYVSISYMNTSLLCFQAVFFIVFQMVKLFNVLVTCGRWQVILLIKNTVARVQMSPEQCCWYKPLAALFPRPNHCETTKTFYPAWVVT